jgi:hypothetical protein
MKKCIVVLFILLLFSCNPYEKGLNKGIELLNNNDVQESIKVLERIEAKSSKIYSRKYNRYINQALALSYAANHDAANAKKILKDDRKISSLIIYFNLILGEGKYDDFNRLFHENEDVIKQSSNLLESSQLLLLYYYFLKRTHKVAEIDNNIDYCNIFFRDIQKTKKKNANQENGINEITTYLTEESNRMEKNNLECSKLKEIIKKIDDNK